MTNWAAIDGVFDFSDITTFRGEPLSYKTAEGEERVGLSLGLAISNQRFTGGDISAQVEFDKIGDRNSCELVFYYDPVRRWFASAGIGGPGSMFVVRHWEGKWVEHALAGSRKSLQPAHPYNVRVNLRGSQVTLWVDDVEVVGAVLPFALPPSQTGIVCLDDTAVKIRDFKVGAERGRVFVVMQFSPPFTDLHDVIKNVCDEFGLDAHRADETYGPGMVAGDITRDITQSEFVIAEITPANPNVYYELGYAHATNKPAILLADRQAMQKAPFDVAHFRIMFYENTISGRQKFEDGLRRHIGAILKTAVFSSRAGGGLT